MSAALPASNARAVESLLSFWAWAGVDACLEDEAVNRTVRPAASAPSRPAISGKAPAARPVAPTPLAAIPAPPASGEAIAEARRLAAEAPSLDALAATIAGFDGCSLKSAGARQSVFSRGAANAPIFVIGEAPGADEDMQGAPFVGRAGQLLDRMLRAAGLDERVFITNTVFWRPPGNRTPSLTEQQVCAPFLERAIDLVQPRLLLLVGAASAKAMLGASEGILSLRGRWFNWRSSTGGEAIPALPTLHPAFLLRQPAAKKKAWIDLLMLAERLDRQEPPSAA